MIPERQDPTNFIQRLLVDHMKDAVENDDVGFAGDALASAKIGANVETSFIISEAQRRIEVAETTWNRKEREINLTLACEITECGWRNSHHNKDSGLILAKPPRPRFTIITGGKRPNG